MNRNDKARIEGAQLAQIQSITGMMPDPEIQAILAELGISEQALTMSCNFMNYVASHQCKKDACQNRKDINAEFARGRKYLGAKMSALQKAMIKAAEGNKTLMGLAGLAPHTYPKTRALDAVMGHWHCQLEHADLIADNHFACASFRAEDHHKLYLARKTMAKFIKTRKAKSVIKMHEIEMNQNHRKSRNTLFDSYNHFMISLRTNWIMNPTIPWDRINSMLFDPSQPQECPLDEWSEEWSHAA